MQCVFDSTYMHPRYTVYVYPPIYTDIWGYVCVAVGGCVIYARICVCVYFGWFVGMQR